MSDNHPFIEYDLPLENAVIDSVATDGTSTADILDYSGNGYHGSHLGIPQLTAVDSMSDFGKAWQGDGIDRDDNSMGISLPTAVRTLNGNSPWSIEFWVKTQVQASGVLGQIAGKYDTTTGGSLYVIYTVTTGDQIDLQYKKSDNSFGTLGTGNYTVNTWQFVEFSFDGNTLRCFLGGVQMAIQAGITFAADINLPLTLFRAFYNAAGGGAAPLPCTCILDEVRFSNIARHTTNYMIPTMTFEPDANAVALYHFNGVMGRSRAANAVLQQQQLDKLTEIEEELDATNAVLGTVADIAVTGDNPGTNSSKLRGLLKTLADVYDAASHWLQVKVMNTVPVTVASLPLPAGAMTETTGQAILAELRDDIFVEHELWVDGSVNPDVYYRLERKISQDDQSVTTVITRLSDNVVVGSLPAGAEPVAADTNKKVEFYRYIAINAGTGYSVNNLLTNTLVFDVISATVISNSWYNLSTSAAILAPLAADIKEPLPNNAAKESGGNLDSIKNKTDNIDVLLSTRLKPADTLTKVATVDTITNPVSVTQSTTPWATNDVGLPDTLGQKTMSGSTSVVIASDQSSFPVTTTPSGTQDVNIVKYGGAATSLGQKASASSQPVVLSTEQETLVNTIITRLTTLLAMDFPQNAASVAAADGVSNTLNQPADLANNPLMQLAYNTVFNGTTWDRMRGDATNGLQTKTQLYDAQTGGFATINTFGDLVSVPYQELSAGNFANDDIALDTIFWTLTHGGSGTTIVANGMVSIASGTTASTTEGIQGTQYAPFNTISPNRYVSGLRLGDAGISGNQRAWGVRNAAKNNGYYFRLNAAVFQLVSLKAGVETIVSSGSFNGVLGTTFLPGTDAKIYFIDYSGGGAKFYVIVNGALQLIHSVTPPAGITTNVGSLLFTPFIDNINTSNTTSVLIEGRGQGIGRLGVIDSYQLKQALTDNTYAQPVRAVLTGRNATNSFFETFSDLLGNIGATKYNSAPLAAKIFNNTITAAGTLLTIPLGMKWVGKVRVSCAIRTAAVTLLSATDGNATLTWTPGTGGTGPQGVTGAYVVAKAIASVGGQTVTAVAGTNAFGFDEIETVLYAGSTAGTIVLAISGVNQVVATANGYLIADTN